MRPSRRLSAIRSSIFRVDGRSGWSSSRVSQSKSKTTTFPPDRDTRTISASARSGASRCMKVRSVCAPSNVWSGRSRRWASPTRYSSDRQSPTAHRRASANIASLLSTPMTWPPGATKRPSARASSPVPQPRSRMRWPIRSSTSAAILRLHACTDAISLAASTKRTKNFGSTVASTWVKRSTVAACAIGSPPEASHAIRFPWRLGCLIAGPGQRGRWLRCAP